MQSNLNMNLSTVSFVTSLLCVRCQTLSFVTSLLCVWCQTLSLVTSLLCVWCQTLSLVTSLLCVLCQNKSQLDPTAPQHDTFMFFKFDLSQLIKLNERVLLSPFDHCYNVYVCLSGRLHPEVLVKLQDGDAASGVPQRPVPRASG